MSVGDRIEMVDRGGGRQEKENKGKRKRSDMDLGKGSSFTRT